MLILIYSFTTYSYVFITITTITYSQILLCVNIFLCMWLIICKNCWSLRTVTQPRTQFFIRRIFNLLLSTAAAFGVKDYRGRPVNFLGLEWARWEYDPRIKSAHGERLLSPSPGPLSDWGWDAPAGEAQGSEDTSSPIWHCDPSLHLDRK